MLSIKIHSLKFTRKKVPWEQRNCYVFFCYVSDFGFVLFSLKFVLFDFIRNGLFCNMNQTVAGTSARALIVERWWIIWFMFFTEPPQRTSRLYYDRLHLIVICWICRHCCLLSGAIFVHVFVWLKSGEENFFAIVFKLDALWFCLLMSGIVLGYDVLAELVVINFICFDCSTVKFVRDNRRLFHICWSVGIAPC